MERMLSPKRPFYKAAVMRLEKIPPTSSPRRSTRGSSDRHAAGRRLGESIVELAGNLPYDVQRLAHETWTTCAARTRPARDARGSAPGLKRLLASSR